LALVVGWLEESTLQIQVHKSGAMVEQVEVEVFIEFKVYYLLYQQAVRLSLVWVVLRGMIIQTMLGLPPMAAMEDIHLSMAIRVKLVEVKVVRGSSRTLLQSPL
jgi:hypothetical protein